MTDDNCRDYSEHLRGKFSRWGKDLSSKNELRERGQTPAINRPLPPTPLDHIPADPPIDPWKDWLSEEYRTKVLRDLIYSPTIKRTDEHLIVLPPSS